MNVLLSDKVWKNSINPAETPALYLRVLKLYLQNLKYSYNRALTEI